MATAFTLASVDVTGISSIGGQLLTLYGTFPTGSMYLAAVTDTTTGSTGNVSLCLSGVQGDPLLLRPLGSKIYCFTPHLADTVRNATLTLMAVDGTAATPVPLTVHFPFYESHVFTLRGVLPNIYRTGARSIAQVQARLY